MRLRCVAVTFGSVDGITGTDAVTDSVADAVGELHYGIETRCLQQHLVQKAGKVYDAGNGQVSDLRKLLMDTGAGFERTGV